MPIPELRPDILIVALSVGRDSRPLATHLGREVVSFALAAGNGRTTSVSAGGVERWSIA